MQGEQATICLNSPESTLNLVGEPDVVLVAEHHVFVLAMCSRVQKVVRETQLLVRRKHDDLERCRTRKLTDNVQSVVSRTIIAYNEFTWLLSLSRNADQLIPNVGAPIISGECN